MRHQLRRELALCVRDLARVMDRLADVLNRMTEQDLDEVLEKIREDRIEKAVRR
jgi:hypothetical protein